MSIKTVYRKIDNVLVIEEEGTGVTLREVPCASHQSAIHMAAIARDMYDFGRQSCINEIVRTNEILNLYNISGIRTPKK